eukprot:350505-Chlamydomonas_euryale.AAC.4
MSSDSKNRGGRCPAESVTGAAALRRRHGTARAGLSSAAHPAAATEYVPASKPAAAETTALLGTSLLDHELRDAKR